MNLYIWNNPWKVSYGGACIFAVAESEEAARCMVADKMHFGIPGNELMSLAEIKLGAPTVVSTLPVAKVYIWQE